jgi:putative ABC transport system permease protein
MIKNYLKIAVRNLLKRKGFSLINILGLATGMAVCLLIVLFVQSETSYDEHHERGDNVYRLALERHYPGRVSSYAIIPQSFAAALKTEFPEVMESVRFFNFAGNGNNFLLRIGEKVFEGENVFGADSNFFRVFSGKFLQGDPQTALLNANSVVLNETTAKKYYGSVDGAIGKTFQTDAQQNNIFKITGVVEDWPSNSHFTFDMLISTTGLQFTRGVNFVNFSAYTYLLLKPGSSQAALDAKMPAFVKKYVSGHVERLFGTSFDQFVKDGNGYTYFLQPLKKIHLTSDLESELSPNGSMRAVYIFSVVAIFILFIACINFVNLSTARSVERAREVGIRKTFGSDRNSLIGQFLMESTMISLLAIIVAFGLIALILPLFNQISGKTLTIGWFLQPMNIVLIVAFTLLVGIAAGLYPAFILSSFKPILVLKGRFKTQKFGLALRNGLVVFQFAISVILIVCTIIVNNQMQFMMGEKLGFKKDHVIIVEATGILDENTEAFKTELGRIAGIESVSGTSAMPGQGNFFGSTFQEIGNKEQVTGRGLLVDDKYADVLSLEMKEGRFFSRNFGTDTVALVLNEKAVEEFKLKNPIGARMTSPDNFLNAQNGDPITYTVVGVVKDFHFQSLHSKINPLIFINNARFGGVANQTALRIKASEFENAVAGIEKTWKKFINNRPFHYSFLDQTLARQYQAEQTTQKIFTVFALLAIFIACIGLLGLAAYTTQQRIKEIGIRKVLGASMQQIITMLSKDFLKLVLIGSLIAFPLAWWGMHKWLEEFAYHVNIGWWVFAVAAGLAAFIALATISFQAIKAAMSNPVKSLRTE